MADLLTSERPADGSANGALRPLAVGAAVSGVVCAAAALLACVAVAIGGWLASGAAARDSTADAVRVGADAWLLGLGAHLQLADAQVTAVPLGLSLVSARACYWTGRWVRRGAADPGLWGTWLGAAVMAGGYGVVAAVTAGLASTEAAHPRPMLAFSGAFVLALLSGGIGMLSEPDRPWRSRLPEPVAATVTAGLATVLVTVAVCALVLAGSLLHGFGAAANVLSGLGADPVGALLYTIVVGCVAPNAVLLTGSYLVGAGFRVGVSTVVSPTAVSLGPVPAFPLLAALPGDGPTPGWVPLLMGLPVLAAAGAAVLAVRRHPVRRYELGALRGLAGGVCGGVLLALLVSLAGGSVGPGRMSGVGVGLGQVLPMAVLSLGLGGVLGGLLGTWLVRRS